MANLTITVDEETLKRARIKAVERGESVNAFLAEQLRNYANQADRQAQVMATLRDLSDQLESGSGPEGRTWTRDELYEARLAR
jgi:plasmid stability protein